MQVAQISPSVRARVEVFPSPHIRGGKGQGEGGVRRVLPGGAPFFFPLRNSFWASAGWTPAGLARFSGSNARRASIVAAVPAPLTPTLSPRPAGREADVCGAA